MVNNMCTDQSNDPENWRSWLTPVEAPEKLTRQVGIMGSRPLGADYMPGINRRANRLRAACRDEGENDAGAEIDPRQGRLPGF
ncbi:MAG: hypothetical protein PHH28_10380 [Desulfuromonadaceae bacterium]|nr:hypothetical protein [Desulfuromonadaceae bacterium]